MTPNSSPATVQPPTSFFKNVSGWLLLVFLITDRTLLTQRVSLEEITGVDALDEYAKFHIIYTALIAVWLSYQTWAKGGAWVLQRLVSGPLLWLFLYILLAGISMFWSPTPMLTGFRALQCLIFLIVVIDAIETAGSMERALKLMFLVSACYLLTAYISFANWTVPEYGFSLYTLHFVVGAAPFLGLLFLVGIAGKTAPTRIFFYVMIFALLIETVFSGYGAVILGLFTYWYVRANSIWRYQLPLLAVAGAVGAWLLILQSGNELLFGLKSVDEILTGTGRFEVWAYALTNAFTKEPILGYGFVAGDALPRVSGINLAMGQLHNSHLSSIINLGMLGGTLWIMFLVTSYIKIAKIRDRKIRAAFAAAAASYAVQQMFGGASLSSSLHVVWVSHAMFFATIALYWPVKKPSTRTANLNHLARDA